MSSSLSRALPCKWRPHLEVVEFGLITSSNIVYICIFITIELCFTLEASSYFTLADENAKLSAALMKAAGVFGFLAGLLGFYATAHDLCQDVLPFNIPMGDTSRVVKRWKKAKNAV